jgi:nitroreductase
MDVWEAIEKRRSIRRFAGPATEEQLRKIILAGTRAPSGGNRQGWEFVIVDDPRSIEQIAENKYQQNRKVPPGAGQTSEDVERGARRQRESFANASIVVVCNKVGEAASAWLAVQNMCLAAVAERLGTCITGFGGEHKHSVEEIVGVPKGYEMAAVVKVGIPAEGPSPPQRRPELSWLHKNRF